MLRKTCTNLLGSGYAAHTALLERSICQLAPFSSLRLFYCIQSTVLFGNNSHRSCGMLEDRLPPAKIAAVIKIVPMNFCTAYRNLTTAPNIPTRFQPPTNNPIKLTVVVDDTGTRFSTDVHLLGDLRYRSRDRPIFGVSTASLSHRQSFK